MSLEYVNPDIGGIGHLLKATYPTVYRPHGMVGVHPQFDPTVGDRYLADHIHGFPVPVQLHRNLTSPLLMPVTGSPAPAIEDCASFFDHDFETTAPHYYQVLLERYDIQAAFTVTRHGVVYRFSFPEDQSPCLLLATQNATLLSVDETTLEGCQELGGGVTGYFCIRFDRPSSSRDPLQSGLRLHFAGSAPLEARIGVSLIDAAQARRNRENELGDRPFAQLVEEARQEWETALAQIHVEGGSEKQRRTLYTALYRYMGRMQNITEEGRYYSGYDGRVHSGEPDFYVTDQIWDTFRSAHPLRLLIDPRRELDMIRSYVRMFTQSGWLPRFPRVGGDVPCMLGHHTVATLVDAYRKGLTDFDVDQAYAAMRKSVTEATKLPWRNGPLTALDRVYVEKGFFPALRPDEPETVPEVHPFEARQAVAVSLEWCYDEYALALMARELGKEKDYAYFYQRAHNYRKLYNPANGFMAPRSAEGDWIEPFDPKLSGGQGGPRLLCRVQRLDLHLERAARRGRFDRPDGRARNVCRPPRPALYRTVRQRQVALSGPVPRLDRPDRPVCHRQRTQLSHPLPLYLCRRPLEDPAPHPPDHGPLVRRHPAGPLRGRRRRRHERLAHFQLDRLFSHLPGRALLCPGQPRL